MTSGSNFKSIDLPSIKIVKTTPKISRQELFSNKRCYFGISLDNPGFYGKSLQALLLWGIGNFDECLVVIGDYLRRYNERILNGLDDKQAARVTHALGDSFMIKAGNFFQQLPAKRVTVTRWETCLRTPEYKKAKASLDELFATNPEFRAAVEKDAFAFIRRQTKRNRKLAVSPEEAVELSCRYLLEEIAVFSALSEQGWKVELYPGPELHVLVEIAKGDFQDIPRGLKQRINVELKICRPGAE